MRAVLKAAPFMKPSYFENLAGDAPGAWSWRTNMQYRLVGEVFEPPRAARVLQMRTHCERFCERE